MKDTIRQLIQQALTQILRDPALRGRLREEGLARAQSFSWGRTAELTWNALRPDKEA